MNYYNDNDPKACAWLRELIAQGCLPPGTVDERSILEIKPDELRGYDQCHFFAGVGFWSLALQWAGLGGASGIWTGSCPCQPWSCAGAGKGHADERHLWPAFRELIRACRPAVVFGEQVASAAVVGKVGRRATPPAVPVWLDGVRADMEASGYAFGASVLGAHSVSAPHIRQRCYWVAHSDRGRCATRSGAEPEAAEREGGNGESEQRGGARGTSYAQYPERRGEQQPGESRSGRSRLGGSCESGGPSIPASGGLGADGSAQGKPGHAEQLREAGGTSDYSGHGLEGRKEQSAREELATIERSGDACRTRDSALPAQTRLGQLRVNVRGQTGGFGWPCDPAGDDKQRDRQSRACLRREITPGGSMPWSDYRVHRYLDGKDRRIPTEPRLFPLADDRHPCHRGRVGLLRGAGNAILPALAAEFVMAWLECNANTEMETQR